MAEPRHREFNTETTHTGSLFWITTRYRTQTVGDAGTCDDFVGNPTGANPLSLYRRHRSTPVLDGTMYYNGKVVRQCTAYPMGYCVNYPPDPRTKFALPTMVECNNRAWEILANTNPSSPHVNVLSFVSELKDIPSLVEGWGRGLLRDASKGYLSWKWAARPMISDVMKVCKFVEAANQRFRQLRNLRDKKTIRERTGLGTDQIVTVPTRVTLNSDGAIIYGWRTDVFTRKMWGSAEWKLLQDSYVMNMEDRELIKLLRKTMLGVNSYGALETAWELCPWSWLIDWFSNVGTMCAASNNAIGCTWGRLCLMQTTTSEVRITVLDADKPSWVALTGDFDWRVVRKDRQVVYPAIPFPTVSLPILDGGKLSILASLAALRR